MMELKSVGMMNLPIDGNIKNIWSHQPEKVNRANQCNSSFLTRAKQCFTNIWLAQKVLWPWTLFSAISPAAWSTVLCRCSGRYHSSVNDFRERTKTKKTIPAEIISSKIFWWFLSCRVLERQLNSFEFNWVPYLSYLSTLFITRLKKKVTQLQIAKKHEQMDMSWFVWK